jgi:hypothetical protein
VYQGGFDDGLHAKIRSGRKGGTGDRRLARHRPRLRAGLRRLRAARKARDLAHTAAAPAQAKTIKLADLIDNTRTIERLDTGFWRVYRVEKIRLLDVLKECDATLWKLAAQQCSTPSSRA